MRPNANPSPHCGSVGLRTEHRSFKSPPSLKTHLLFCPHRGGDDKKEKGGDKTPEHQASGEHEASGKTPKLAHMELNRGTAV